MYLYNYRNDDKEAKKCLREAREIRRKYVFQLQLPSNDAKEVISSDLAVTFKQNDKGIFEVYASSSAGKLEQSETGTSQHSADTANIFPVADWNTFSMDYERCRSIVKESKKVNTFCTKRLTVLEYLFDAHMLLNSDAEN
eukprot:gene47510-64412_t